KSVLVFVQKPALVPNGGAMGTGNTDRGMASGIDLGQDLEGLLAFIDAEAHGIAVPLLNGAQGIVLGGALKPDSRFIGFIAPSHVPLPKIGEIGLRAVPIHFKVATTARYVDTSRTAAPGQQPGIGNAIEAP